MLRAALVGAIAFTGGSADDGTEDLTEGFCGELNGGLRNAFVSRMVVMVMPVGMVGDMVFWLYRGSGGASGAGGGIKR